MPALSISTEHAASFKDSDLSAADSIANFHSTSPPRPSVSPITPVFSHATLASNPSNATPASSGVSPQRHIASFIPQPPPIPISESDNPDAIALRNAISVLQIQREQSKRDLVVLDRIKRAAVDDPDTFIQDVKDKRVAARQYLPLLGDTASNASNMDQDSEAEAEDRSHNLKTKGFNKEDVSKFEPVPAPQIVVRCPPINWAKYHIAGDSLDKLHQEQLARPSPGEPQRDEATFRMPEHFVAAPYRPFADRIVDHPMRTRNAGKRK